MKSIRKLMLVALLPLLMAAKCNSQVTLSRPLNGSTYCSDIPIQYEYALDSEYGARVIVGAYHQTDNYINILQNYTIPPASYTRTGSATLPWGLISYERGKDINIFIDVVYPDNTIPAAGTTVPLNRYKEKVPLENLYSRVTRSVRICS